MSTPQPPEMSTLLVLLLAYGLGSLIRDLDQQRRCTPLCRTWQFSDGHTLHFHAPAHPIHLDD